MNLKESFRYQNFLDMMMRAASASIQQRDHCLKVTKTHLRSKAKVYNDTVGLVDPFGGERTCMKG